MLNSSSIALIVFNVWFERYMEDQFPKASFLVLLVLGEIVNVHDSLQLIIFHEESYLV